VIYRTSAKPVLSRRQRLRRVVSSTEVRKSFFANLAGIVLAFVWHLGCEGFCVVWYHASFHALLLYSTYLIARSVWEGE